MHHAGSAVALGAAGPPGRKRQPVGVDQPLRSPIKHEEEREEICERYRRYCFIVQKVLEGIQQSLAKNANEQR